MSHGTVKDINGKDTCITGTDTLRLCIKADNGTALSLPEIQAVYIPQSPYNLLSPQLLICHLKSHHYHVPPFEHSDTEYIFSLRPPSSLRLLQFTCPINFKKLCTFFSKDGYQHFQQRVHHLSPTCSSLTGPVHVIPDDNASATDPILCQPIFPPPSTTRENIVPESPASKSSLKTREVDITSSNSSPNKTREVDITSHDKTREADSPSCNKTREVDSSSFNKTRETIDTAPVTVPFIDTDFSPLKSKPTSTTFDIVNTNDNKFLADARIASTRQKQLRLLIIHETLGHLSF